MKYDCKCGMWMCFIRIQHGLDGKKASANLFFTLLYARIDEGQTLIITKCILRINSALWFFHFFFFQFFNICLLNICVSLVGFILFYRTFAIFRKALGKALVTIAENFFLCSRSSNFHCIVSYRNWRSYLYALDQCPSKIIRSYRNRKLTLLFGMLMAPKK